MICQLAPGPCGKTFQSYRRVLSDLAAQAKKGQCCRERASHSDEHGLIPRPMALSAILPPILSSVCFDFARGFFAEGSGWTSHLPNEGFVSRVLAIAGASAAIPPCPRLYSALPSQLLCACWAFGQQLHAHIQGSGFVVWLPRRYGSPASGGRQRGASRVPPQSLISETLTNEWHGVFVSPKEKFAFCVNSRPAAVVLRSETIVVGQR
jgi:hypothetical protein